VPTADPTLAAQLVKAVREAVAELVDSEIGTATLHDVVEVHLGRALTDDEQNAVIAQTRTIRDAIRRPFDTEALCWTPANGSGWLLCGMVHRDGRVVPNTDDLRGLIANGLVSGHFAVTYHPNTLDRWGKRRRTKSMEGARRSLARILGRELPPLPEVPRG
jgi:hypothetical protein